MQIKVFLDILMLNKDENFREYFGLDVEAEKASEYKKEYRLTNAERIQQTIFSKFRNKDKENEKSQKIYNLEKDFKLFAEIMVSKNNA